MKRQRASILLIMLCLTSLCSGCASKWALQTESPKVPPQWPDSAGKTRIRHLMTITGFEQVGASLPGIVRAIVFGRSGNNLLNRPVATAVGADDRLAIADTGCRCVHLYIPAERNYLKLYGGPEEMRSPVGVTFDDELRLFVSDSARGAIDVFDRRGAFVFSLKKAGDAPLKRPTGLAWSPKKKTVFAVDSLAHKIYAFNTKGDLLFSFGERGDKKGQFNFPTHISFAPSGQLFVTDAMNFRIQSFDASGRFLFSFGRHGDGSGDFAMPKGVAADSAGIIYVVDGLFDNIQLFNGKGDFLLTLGGRGSGNGEFWLPSGIFFDDHDKLYVCDTYNKRLQVFQIERDQHE